MTEKEQAFDFFKASETVKYAGLSLEVRGLTAEEIVDLLAGVEDIKSVVSDIAKITSGGGVESLKPAVKSLVKRVVELSLDRNSAEFVEALRSAEIVPAGLQAVAVAKCWKRSFPGGLQDFLDAIGIQLAA